VSFDGGGQDVVSFQSLKASLGEYTGCARSESGWLLRRLIDPQANKWGKELYNFLTVWQIRLRRLSLALARVQASPIVFQGPTTIITERQDEKRKGLGVNQALLDLDR